MSRRVAALAAYLLRTLVQTITGAILFFLVFAFWLVAFNPRIRTPEPEYFISLVGLLGGVLSVLATLALAAIANRTESMTLVVRLRSRVEYLTGVLLAALAFTLALQLLVAVVVLLQPGGPDIPAGRLLEIPPLWFSLNIVAAAVALHASDFAAKGWSRVAVFGVLVVLLFGQEIEDRTTVWVSQLLRRIASFMFNQGWNGWAQPFNRGAGWMSTNGAAFFDQTFGFVFWPFRAIAEAVRTGSFDVAQALAPAILLLYATILFMLAADLFATKDLQLSD